MMNKSGGSCLGAVACSGLNSSTLINWAGRFLKYSCNVCIPMDQIGKKVLPKTLAYMPAARRASKFWKVCLGTGRK